MTPDIPPPSVPCECAPATVETPTARLARLKREVRDAEHAVRMEELRDVAKKINERKKR